MAIEHSDTAWSEYHPDVYTDTDTGERYEVLQDDGPEDPRRWTPGRAEVMVYRTCRNGTTDEPQGDLAAAFYDIYDRTGDDGYALRVVERYARLCRPGWSVDTFSLHGYSQSDWWDVFVAVEDGYGTPESHAETFKMWACGDVWLVREEDGDWLGGIYADDAEGAVREYVASQ